MGSCISRNGAGGGRPPTAMVITLGGSLREYPYPTHLTAAHVLAGDGASCFVCNSDRLLCDHYIPQLGPEEQLRPGQLYFILPSSKLQYPLSGGDMKELLVRASSALTGASPPPKSGRESKKATVMLAVAASEVNGGHWATVGGRDMYMDQWATASGELSLRRRCSSGKAHRSVNSRAGKLSSIPEVAEPLLYVD